MNTHVIPLLLFFFMLNPLAGWSQNSPDSSHPFSIEQLSPSEMEGITGKWNIGQRIFNKEVIKSFMEQIQETSEKGNGRATPIKTGISATKGNQSSFEENTYSPDATASESEGVPSSGKGTPGSAISQVKVPKVVVASKDSSEKGSNNISGVYFDKDKFGRFSMPGTRGESGGGNQHPGDETKVGVGGHGIQWKGGGLKIGSTRLERCWPYRFSYSSSCWADTDRNISCHADEP